MQPFTIAGVRIGLASPAQIRSWSSGEVKEPTTINYRTQKPEKDGLFCERIFGPTQDWTCACRKYVRQQRAGQVCEQCGVELALARVRRERMGHIELSVPVVHPWFLRGAPSILSLLLDLPPSQCLSVVFCTGYLVTNVREEAQTQALHMGYDPRNTTERDLFTHLSRLGIGTYLEASTYAGLSARYPGCCRVETGTQAIQAALTRLDLATLSTQLRQACHEDPKQKRARKRLQVVEAFSTSGIHPEWLVLTVLPVLPPELRPLVPLSGGRYATSDLNTLYERILHRNKRVRHFQTNQAPTILLHHEQRLLQKAVGALLDNRHMAQPMVNGRRQPLKSLTDALAGKRGRFRRNLLGKRVDYSGRSVIVGNPQLKLHQCGLPKIMACELFKPFLIRKLVDRHLARSARHAKYLVERRDSIIWDQLAECLFERVVLLNRAPTLHRLSIQAFEPILTDGSAIQLHPQVCSAFNADFDGDQMAVHVPLSDKAQAEARQLMLSTHNLRSPASGEPSITISQEQVLGLYYLTEDRPSPKRAGRIFADVNEALHALETNVVDLHTKITVRLEHPLVYDHPAESIPVPSGGRHDRVETTTGRLIFNEVLPEGMGYKNYPMTKDALKQLVAEALARFGEETTAQMCDALKTLGFTYATRSGLSFAIADIVMPPEREVLNQQGRDQQQELDALYRDGEITHDEWYHQVIAIWHDVTDRVSDAAKKALPTYGTLMTIVKSGATKAKFQQIRQLSGIRGLMADPTGAILPVPILSNYLVGQQGWEIFVASRGARKGFMDRSLNTAPSGYLTRKLVEAGMSVLITMADCGTHQGILLTRARSDAMGGYDLQQLLVGRVLAQEVRGLLQGTMLSEAMAKQLVSSGHTGIWIRSPLTCEAQTGLCQRCYGRDPARRTLVQIHTAVGVIAGQSIGEPGTQLTMRTFHSGGIANAVGDITLGLPRVSELFEANTPRRKAVLATQAGWVRLEGKVSEHGKRRIHIMSDHDEDRHYEIPPGEHVMVDQGAHVEVGTPLTSGAIDPKELLQLCGIEATSWYLMSEVQRVYCSTGVYLSNQHLEVIVRQMLRFVEVTEEGDTPFVLGEHVERMTFLSTNAAILAQGGMPARAFPILFGLTQTTLKTRSWIAAASFQEASRILTQAAIRNQYDPLEGLKEKIILGLPIPSLEVASDVH